MASILLRRTCGNRHTGTKGRRSCSNRDRDWSEVATGNTQATGQEEAKNDSPSEPREGA